ELSGSEYITIFFIVPSILALMEKLDCFTSNLEKSNNTLNFETTNFVFDDNVRFTDAREEGEDGSKERKIKINTPTDVIDMKHKIKNSLYSALLHYWDLSDDEVFIACLLDPRFKKLRFASSSQQYQTEAALREKYNNIKSLHQSSLTSNFNEIQPLAKNNWKEQRQIYHKTFFNSIFIQNTSKKPNDELNHYFFLPKISYESNLFYW
ncbi:24334_t:CDS:1, partial [Racocetra persica]